MQLPTSWTADSIDIQVNQGSFNEGEEVYLFVIDENGKASKSYPLSFSGDPQILPSPDINNDGQVNVHDVIMCVNIVLGTATVKADVNEDGQTTVQDVTAVVNDILGN